MGGWVGGWGEETYIEGDELLDGVEGGLEAVNVFQHATAVLCTQEHAIVVDVVVGVVVGAVVSVNVDVDFVEIVAQIVDGC